MKKRDRVGSLDEDTGLALALLTTSRRRVNEGDGTSPDKALVQGETDVMALVCAVAKGKKRSMADQGDGRDRNRRFRRE